MNYLPRIKPSSMALLLAATAGLMLVSVAGQTSDATSQPPRKDEDDIVQLSPFTVSAENASRYVASSTLAGTRLRTDLRDIGASVSVVTKEFLDDTASNNLQELLVYTVGTEVAGLGGNYSGAQVSNGSVNESDNLNSIGGANNRVRGLAAASLTRDFLSSNIPFDSYNTERVEVNRGANAILFGLGSPAGIINFSTLRPLFSNRFQFQSQFSSYDSHRESFDLNAVVVDNQVALRVALLNQEKSFQQEFAYDDSKRAFAALVVAPKWAKRGFLSGTVLRADAEKGELRSNRPRVIPPVDQITPWFTPFAPGAPVKYSWNAGTQATQDANLAVVTTTSNVFRNPTVVYENPDSTMPGMSAYGTGVIGFQGISSNAVVRPNGALGTAVFHQLTSITAALNRAGNADSGYYYNPTVSDASVFDFRNQMVDGPNKHLNTDFDTFKVTLEQRFFDDTAGFELVLNRESSEKDIYQLVGISSTIVTVDLNTHLLSGAVNPNYGRPYTIGLGGRGMNDNDKGDLRFTGYVQIDPKKYSKSRFAEWLGTHTMTVLLNDSFSETKTASSTGLSMTTTPYIYGTGSQTDRFNISGPTFSSIYYLGGSVASQSSASNSHISGLQVAYPYLGQNVGNNGTFIMRNQTATGVYRPTNLPILDDNEEMSELASQANLSRTEIRSQAFVLQSKLLKDHLVGIFGWRRDEIDTFTAPNPARTANNNFILDTLQLPSSPSGQDAGDTFTWSAVGHLPKAWIKWIPGVSSLSLYVSSSENFAQLGARKDALLNDLTPPSGSTKDIGFTLGLMDEKLLLRANWYETPQSGVGADVGTSVGTILSDYVRVINNTVAGFNPGLDPFNIGASGLATPSKEILDAYGFQQAADGTAVIGSRPDIVNTTDLVSKGMELELTYSPLRNWSIIMNAARQEAVRSNSATALYEFWAVEKQANGQTLKESWLGPVGQKIRPTTTDTFLDRFTLLDTEIPLSTYRAGDGSEVRELRKWRFNVVTNYQFTNDSRLRGWSVGGGYRWQDRAAIGYANKTDSNGSRVVDINNPYYGPTETQIDAWIGYQTKLFHNKVGLKVQLNVRDLLNNTDLIPVQAQPTGEVAISRIPEGRVWELTSTFTF